MTASQLSPSYGLGAKMAARQQHNVENVEIAASFIETKAPEFHSAFGGPSSLNRSTMQYEEPEVSELRKTLECHHQRASKYVDFTSDLNSCNWDTVREELHKAKEMAIRSKERGKNVVKFWRRLGSTSSILAPGLSAFPDELCVLHGGLAVIFSVRSSLPAKAALG